MDLRNIALVLAVAGLAGDRVLASLAVLVKTIHYSRKKRGKGCQKRGNGRSPR